MKNLPVKPLFFGLFFIVSSFFSLYAANVSMVVLETGAAALAAREPAGLWEEGIMEVFFNDGHIISNAKAKKIGAFPKQEFPEEALRDFQDADEGGSKYFIVALLNYGDELCAGAARPVSVTIRLFHVTPYQFLTETTIEDVKKAPVEDELNIARDCAKDISVFIGRIM
jgi:hypothetical protein